VSARKGFPARAGGRWIAALGHVRDGGRSLSGARAAQQGLPLFLAGVLLALSVAYVLRDTPGWELYNVDGTIANDVRAYIRWARRSTLDGIQDVYTRTPADSPAVYGPVVLYPGQLVGHVYRLVVDPPFDRARAEASATEPGAWLPQAFKVVAVAWHLLTATAIYALLRRMTPPSSPLAGIAAGLYAANPAALLDAADWAQPDGAHTLFVVLAVGWLEAGRLLRGWAALALGALAKPQAWVLLPFLVLVTLHLGGTRGLLRGLAVGAGIGVIVLLPFLGAGRPDAILGLPTAVATALPVISGNAHNLWWIVAVIHRASPLEILDSAPLLGPLSYRTTAAVLVLAALLFAFWLYRSGRAELAEAAALATLGWFVFTTGAHENHLALVLGLLTLAWPWRPMLLVAFGLVTGTSLLNLVLQDDFLLAYIGLGGSDPPVRVVRAGLRTGNAVLNLVCFGGWAIAAARRVPSARPA
jgi:hypothetical protein